MSKDFELMQQLEKEKSFRPGFADAPAFSRRDPSAVTQASMRAVSEEAFKLAQQIFLLQGQVPPKVVIFAGVDHGSGCSQMSASVAEILAKHSRRPVCLVEANFRSPALPELFGTTNHHGLTDAILHTGPIKSFAKLISGDNLWLLSAGALAEDSPNLLTSEFLRERMAELRENFDFILIDAPPLTRYSDAIVLGQQSDGLILILEAGATRREAALVATSSLRSANIPILAAVLNKRTFPIPQLIYNKL
jgi:capsular exopolysaccharide synthesis family protein